MTPFESLISVVMLVLIGLKIYKSDKDRKIDPDAFVQKVRNEALDEVAHKMAKVLELLVSEKTYALRLENDTLKLRIEKMEIEIRNTRNEALESAAQRLDRNLDRMWGEVDKMAKDIRALKETN